MELVDRLDEGEIIKIILDDTDSLRSVAQELKVRGIQPGFARNGETKYILTISK